MKGKLNGEDITIHEGTQINVPIKEMNAILNYVKQCYENDTKVDQRKLINMFEDYNSKATPFEERD